ncbi:hypothetical protein FXO37_10314 [Capsicum annuum]|nr:hypothetical protein FXO37_10314 [Capsicum annuum]
MVALKYPPCELGCDCVGNVCKLAGDTIPYEWPELIGVEIMKAKVTVETTNPNVTGVPLDSKCIRIENICCNRVWLCPDDNGLIKEKPVVGQDPDLQFLHPILRAGSRVAIHHPILRAGSRVVISSLFLWASSRLAISSPCSSGELPTFNFITLFFGWAPFATTRFIPVSRSRNTRLIPVSRSHGMTFILVFGSRDARFFPISGSRATMGHPLDRLDHNSCLYSWHGTDTLPTGVTGMAPDLQFPYSALWARCRLAVSSSYSSGGILTYNFITLFSERAFDF